MKLLAVFFLVPVLGWDMLDREDNMMNMWSGMKARESCWGKDNVNIYTVRVKEAMEKCQGVQAPELDLPIYKHPFRFIATLLSNSNRNDQYDFQRDDWSRNYNSYQSDYMRERRRNRDRYGDQFNTRNMNRYGNQFNMRNMDRYTSRDGNYGQMRNNYNQQSYDFQTRDEQNRNTLEQIVSMLNHGDSNYRFKRQARHGVNQQSTSKSTNQRSQNSQPSPTYKGQLSTGDRFVEKLQYFQKESEEKIGNFTCAMKELRVIDDNNRIDVRGMKMELEKYTMPSQWFKDHITDNLQMCYQMSEAVQKDSQEKYNYPGGPNFGKLRAFLKCIKSANKKTCLRQDLKVKLESQFGPLQNILDQTQLAETQLFDLFMEIFYGEKFMEFQGIYL